MIGTTGTTTDMAAAAGILYQWRVESDKNDWLKYLIKKAKNCCDVTYSVLIICYSLSSGSRTVYLL